jgi:hypothetical protein
MLLEVYEKKQEERKLIISTLMRLGMEPGTLGFCYSVEILEMIKDLIRTNTLMSSKPNVLDMYKEEGKKHNTSWRSVERVVRNSIERTFTSGSNTAELTELFGSSISYETGKMTSKNFLFGVAISIFGIGDVQ